ncbi:putative integron gene cassette protein [Candidatus Moduliflexus flocculans]|uniref:Putative integron gene cassette protein n=1 Tax=Candidatus Moduliflexus flocculans TaxID=1499966 RepID=A0A0S6VV58_9BACT|nr:putative integron gene cassette protein [Candidatus Moduliflexus flocculans]
MTSFNIGTTTLATTEILNVSQYGVWIAIKGHEYFLSYQDFPWFKDGTIAQILHVELLHDEHLYWPDLDIDLTIDSLRRPEHYPLLYHESSRKMSSEFSPIAETKI